jgi:hypothetical protein
VHVFVDESMRRDLFLLCAVTYESRSLAAARAMVRRLSGPGQSRVHMTKERASRRREILSAVTGSPVQARIYTSTGRPVEARRRCVTHMLHDLATVGARVHRIALESAGEPEDNRDRATIVLSRRQYPSLHETSYEHFRPHEEPLLSVADVIAWAYGAGGPWRQQVEGVIEKIVALDETGP